MKKVLILFIFILTMTSCKYKITSPYSEYDISLGGNENKTLSVIDANASADEIINSLENNKKITGKNIIVVVGHISSSAIFDNMKIALKNESNVELDLSNAILDNDYTFTSADALFLKTVLFASTQKIIADFFKGCTSLANVQLPYSLISVNNASFDGCSSLKNVEYLGTSPNVITGTTLSGTKPTDLYLPNVSSQNDAWKNFLGIAWVNIHYGVSMPK
ncbi:leucine-rich repeat protein [uncultured Brachyspira sp.]|uniref:leucine-rich repeat protein n=1 Tax=uncultured Brachyspira sp. TaxID=221953 RepID=UPI002610EA86|nr:leucine-rich repeat protein [uncultured Brachyspira sp.]